MKRADIQMELLGIKFQIQDRGYAVIKTNDVKRKHRVLYKAAKLRGYKWRFGKHGDHDLVVVPYK
jgi:hypothetical protein